MRFLVDLHTHTVASDHAYSTINDYVMYASRNGISMFATTDHGPALEDAPHPWHFRNLRCVPHVVDDIAILRGIEANIMGNGDIDLEEKYAQSLDIVLAGFHPCLPPSDIDTHTRLLKQIIEGGRVDIITHPGNPKYPIHMREVLECAKEHNVAIELNSSSDVNTRHGSHAQCVEIARLAQEIGNTIALGTDAHVCYYLGNFRSLDSIIEESGLRYDHIINTSPMKVLEFLESRGHKPIESLHNLFTFY